MKDRLDKAIELYKQISNSCDDAKEKCKTCKRSKECDFYCDFASPMDVSFYLNQIVDLFSKEPSIQLKNIDLTGYSEHEQVSKYLEESNELIKVIIDKDSNSSFEHFCEEVFDQLQVCIGIAEKKYNKTANDVMAEYPKHILKMEQRGNKPREKAEK